MANEVKVVQGEVKDGQNDSIKTIEGVQIQEMAFEQMKNDFNFMKTKFSPNFLSRMEKSIQSL